ncbi:MAG: hydroxyisourate hydrolase [Ginsengibacter sp.]|jgi:5-hydroxyisourate hydrolase
MSRITTHILDTSKGKPAAGVKVILFQLTNDWQLIGSDVTNKDGRITELPQVENSTEKTIFKLKFETQEYFDENNTESFYPFIEITFAIQNEAHYHVPLLLNPFGYSTYRGS